MELFDRATMPALRRKGDQLTGYLEFLLRAPRGGGAHSPGARLHADGALPQRAGMVPELKRRGVEVDLRPPDIVRITPMPLYTSFEDVRRFCGLIAELQDG